MSVTARFRSVTKQELDHARQDPAFAARLLDELPEGDETPLDSHLSVQRRTFSIERFSLALWEGLVSRAPVNVFVGQEYLDLNFYYDDEVEEDDEDEYEEEPDQAMELEPGLIAELAGWLRDVRFEDVYDGPDAHGFVRGDFEEFRTFVLAVAERGDGALLYVG